MATRGWSKATMPSKGARIGSGKVQGRSKYNAVKTTVDGVTFDSKAEARRYSELKLMEKASDIQGLELQPIFDLLASDGVHRPVYLGKYVADFRYYRGMEEIVEDVKGFKTPLYRWKKKHVEAQYGLTIKEIR